MHVARRLIGIAVLTVVAVMVLANWPFSASTSARLVSVQPLPDGSVCEWQQGGMTTPSAVLASVHGEQRREAFFTEWQQGLQQRNLFAAMQRGGGGPIPEPLVELSRAPLSTLRDTYPTYTAVVVNLLTDEVVLMDNNLWSVRVFNRLGDTPPGAESLEPKRIIAGSESHIQFNNGLYLDQANGDMYSVESDVGDKMVVFSVEATGNVPPSRELVTPHRAYNIAVDEEKQELYVSREYPGEVVVYRKQASGNEKPLRVLQGDKTGLEAPHGIAIDEENQLLFVNNWGLADGLTLAGSGRFNPPSIKVYALGASDNTPPLRVIQGDRTQLNWPGAMSLDPETGDLYVANDVDHSVLVFSGSAYINGNVPPARVIKGSRTGLRNPTGVFVDTQHQELWVSNLGNSSAVAFPLSANGDVEPLRTIRSAPEGHLSMIFGRTTGVTFDTNRQELIVPN